ncbi:uncharacterized protein LOC124537538 [Vanessa cardui]|uniref:uncharacterized protein LOC124537538 n=1 Tax=Vanessa cardui TaxID=171605 RepID=UPI001F136092|nr:uncharacterized protein LOC124537538 [Vanessa cardui]
MNNSNDMSDEEFIPFLDSLGVDTYKKSFEWMLNDPDFSDVLRWIYKNLDQNNALSEREEYRYAELEAKGKLLPAQELEGKIASIQNEFEGICLPGDQDTLEDIKLDISMQKEKLMMLEKQEIILKELMAQNDVSAMEAQSAIELLEQEESILEQQLQTAVKHYVDRRTRLAVEMTARSALAVRESAASALGAARSWAVRALRADACAYGALRRELRAAEELLHFAAELRDHALSRAPAALRTKSMNAICAEQEVAEKELQTSNTLLATLISILGSEPSNDASLPIKLYNELLNSIQELNDNINEGYKSKEADLAQIKSSAKPLRDFIWDGCTKQPNCYDRSVAAMSHTLREEMSAVDAKVVKTSGLFNSVKNSDKYNLRKFWQWFLTDQAKLLSTIKSVQRS